VTDDVCSLPPLSVSPDTASGHEIPDTFSPEGRRLGLGLFLWNRRKPALAGLIALGMMVSFSVPRPLQIVFLDVGQGDCVYIKTPSGKVWLSDGGSSSVRELASYRLAPFLRSQGVNSIEYVLISHPDVDHISGIEGLLRAGWQVKHLIMSPTSSSRSSKYTFPFFTTGPPYPPPTFTVHNTSGPDSGHLFNNPF
jgi:glyoxylase-like metal-dependent hydrolase (beta-lactamase superfamily II)